MSIPKSASDVLAKYITLVLSCIDRIYLNVYMPALQSEGGVAAFFRKHRGAQFASSALMEPMSRAFIDGITALVRSKQIPVVQFKNGQRKDDIAKEYLARFAGEEGILFVGKAQEKARVVRTEKRRDPKTGLTYPWLVTSTAMVNFYYFYCVDRDFGPFFIKFCSYFPYTGKLCINGHEYVKRQLSKEGIAYTPLDNGIASCETPERLQQICDDLNENTIETFFGKWLKILPNPYTDADRAAGFHYQLSLLQIEFSLTLVLDQPVAGRICFEQVIRENLDIGRPDHVQLVFARRINKRTPGRFRTRIITEGVIPSLHLEYKSSKVKMYYKEGRALRIETTINNTRDFGIGKRMTNLPKLREIGFAANQRLLEVIRLSVNPILGEETLKLMQEPQIVNNVRIAAMPFAHQGTQNLLQAMPVFRLNANGFDNKELRAHLSNLTGKQPADISQGSMTYHLRRLRLRGLIERIPKTHRYRVTDLGLRVSIFYTAAYDRIMRTGLAEALDTNPLQNRKVAAAFNTLNKAMDKHCQAFAIAA